MKRIRKAAALLAAAFFLFPVKAAPEVSARSALLLDAGSGRVLYEKDADRRSLIASTTKILTGLLVCEHGDLDRIVTVPPEAVGVEGSSMYLRSGERLTVRDLLYGMMLRSGNDAAVALAVCTCGSVERFAQEMNRRAQELGMRDSHFVNPNGLDAEEHYSTARDLSVLAAAAMENEDFRSVVSTRSITVGERVLSNHNKLLWRYEGAVGVKTGYTRAAGRILVSAAERDGRRLIAVTVSDPDDWRDHTALLDWGFAHYQKTVLLEAGQTLARTAVLGGTRPQTALFVPEEVSYPLAEAEEVRIRLQLPAVIFAPTPARQVGTAEILVDGKPVVQIPVCTQEVPAAPPEKKGLLARLFGES